MKALISGAVLAALLALAVGKSHGFAGSNGHSGEGAGGGSGASNGSGHSIGSATSGHSSNAGNAIIISGGASIGRSSNNSGNVGIGFSGGSGNGGKGSGGSGANHLNSSGGKNVLKSNPPPKIAHLDKSNDIHKDTDHAKDHRNSSSNHTSTNHSKHTVNDKHYHSNSKFAYHHKPGQKWDKDEWQHCWYRWWCFHNGHVFWNGGWCWWDPDLSQWCPYVDGDTIPEDYYVKDETPPIGGDAIRIISPDDAGATLTYALNDYSFQINPGDHQDLATDRDWIIAFNRGGDFGDAQYTLEAGEYTFGPSDHGWELYHASASENSAGDTPSDSGLTKNPLPKS